MFSTCLDQNKIPSSSNWKTSRSAKPVLQWLALRDRPTKLIELIHTSSCLKQHQKTEQAQTLFIDKPSQSKQIDSTLRSQNLKQCNAQPQKTTLWNTWMSYSFRTKYEYDFAFRIFLHFCLLQMFSFSMFPTKKGTEVHISQQFPSKGSRLLLG